MSAPDAGGPPLPAAVLPARVDRVAVRPVGPGLLLSLLAGRGAWRLALTLSNFGLLVIWGAEVYADYAAAVGRSIVLVALVSCGVEKAALKLLPRARRARPLLIGGFLAVGGLVALPFVLWVVTALLVGQQGVGALQLVIVSMQGLLGLNLVLVALQRALGRPRREVANFATLAVALLAITALAWLARLTPLGVSAAALLVIASLDVALLRTLPVAPRAWRLLRRRRLLRGLVETMALIGAYDLAAGAALSVVFVVLGTTRFRGDAGWLLLITTMWSLVFNGFTYLLRVFQPQVSVALSRAGGVDAHRHALRLARLAALGVGGWLALLGGAVVALGGDFLPWLHGLPLPLLAIVVLLPRLPVLALAGGAGYVLENSDSGSVRLAAAAAACALAGVLVLSLLLVPKVGAPGAILALSSFEAFQAMALLGGLSAGRRARTGRSAARRSAA